jgi:hypothetical protein
VVVVVVVAEVRYDKLVALAGGTGSSNNTRGDNGKSAAIADKVDNEKVQDTLLVEVAHAVAR